MNLGEWEDPSDPALVYEPSKEVMASALYFAPNRDSGSTLNGISRVISANF
jgi:hypothetical protein